MLFAVPALLSLLKYVFIYFHSKVYIWYFKLYSVVIFRVDPAALSAWSFPLILVKLGTQHICTSLLFDKFSNLHRIFMVNGLSDFLILNDSNTDSESEKIINLLFLDSEIRSRAMLIAQASAQNIEVLFGRCF